MKYIIISIISLLPLITQAQQWRVIALSPVNKCKINANGKLLKKGDLINANTNITFENSQGYVRIYVSSKAPFTLRPNGKHLNHTNELTSVASALIIPQKTSLAIKGGSTSLEVINSLQDLNIWLTGNPSGKGLSPKKRLFIGDDPILYFANNIFPKDSDFFYVSTKDGKPKATLLKKSTNGYRTIVHLDLGNQPTPEKGKSALFYRPKNQKPIPIAQFKPIIIPKVSQTLKAEIKELLLILKKEYGDAHKKMLYGKQKQSYPKLTDEAIKTKVKNIISEKVFNEVYHHFELTFDAQPDHNSIKIWILKNFSNLIESNDKSD